MATPKVTDDDDCCLIIETLTNFYSTPDEHSQWVDMVVPIS